MYLSRLMLAFAVCAPIAVLQAQVSVAGRKIQFHGFMSQGFAYSDNNNYLTMKTTSGSAAMTDGGLNASTQLTDKFRIGAQLYSRNIGNLSNGRVELDWAFGDYRIRDWVGVRAGKVKTAMGLYNDTQDMDLLHTWAMLPQSVYPMDLRASTIAHTGADVYGDFGLKRFGTLSYTVYTGKRSDDPRGGYRYGLAGTGTPLTSPIRGWMTGADTRWTTPLEGLVLGASFNSQRGEGDARYMAAGGVPFSFKTKRNHTTVFYYEYSVGKLRLAGEYQRNLQTIAIAKLPLPDNNTDSRGWYLSGAYRLMKRLELGTYYSQSVPMWSSPRTLPSEYINDHAVTARVDLTRFWTVKVEGNFMDGYGSPYSLRGFYLQDNPRGLKPSTNMLLIRTGFNF